MNDKTKKIFAWIALIFMIVGFIAQVTVFIYM